MGSGVLLMAFFLFGCVTLSGLIAYRGYRRQQERDALADARPEE